jgi:hypothetical protein
MVRAMLRNATLSLGLLLLVPACGGDDGGGDDGSTGASNATPATPATTTTTMGATDGGTTAPTDTGMETSGTTPPDTGEQTTSTSDDTTTGAPGGTCADYCATMATNCTGALTQWGNEGFCAASCATFPVGAPEDMAGNTLGCRVYHAGAAAADPETHCVHAGPGGSGVCGAVCEGFCTIGMAACPDKWADAAACMAACAMFDDAETYDATDVSGNTLACRLYHATAASVDPVTHCGHIGGDSPTCM